MVVLAVLFPLVAFLFPLAIYLLILGLINRRRGPLVVSGPWDFAGVLFAASGFLLVVGPSVLTGVGDRWRVVRLAGQIRAGQLSGDEWGSWALIWAAYFAIVIVASVVLLWWRRNVTSIYNVEPIVLEQLITRILDGLGLAWIRSGNHYAIRPGTGIVDDLIREEEGARPADVELVSADVAEVPSFELDAWTLMRHVNIVWYGDYHELRRQVEADLERELTHIVSDENPASGWFLSLAALLFCLMFGILLLLLSAILLLGPR